MIWPHNNIPCQDVTQARDVSWGLFHLLLCLPPELLILVGTPAQLNTREEQVEF